MIEHPIQYDLHPSFVDLLYYMGEKCVACFQIRFSGSTNLIFCRLTVIRTALRQNISSVFHDLRQMGINVIIVLNIVFVIGRGHKQRIKVDHFHSKLFQIIQFIQHPLQIAPIKLPDRHRLRRLLVPVFDLLRSGAEIIVFSCYHVV